MSNHKKLIANQALAFAAQLMPAIIGVLSFMLLVRVTSQEALGQFVIYMAAVVLFEMVKSGGLQSALVMRVASCTLEQQREVSGSAYWLSGLFSVSVSLILLILFLTGVFSTNPAIHIFCGLYAILGVITVPINIAEAEAVAHQDLKFLFWLRVTQSASTLLIAVYVWLSHAGLAGLATMHVIINGVLLLVILLLKKTNPLNILHKTKTEVLELYHLIKYTLATLATTNLLKTADTFLIGSMMGPAAVARYAIPLKLTELFEIPLRSLSTTAFPTLAANHNKKDYPKFRENFVQYLSWAYLIYIPALTLALILAPVVILIIGGQKYMDTVMIFRVFVLFGLFLPANRMTGISLDALQLPARNFRKVLIMAIINIVGDVIAIQVTHQLEWVAAISVLNAAVGAVIGWVMLEKTGKLPGKDLGKEIVQYCLHFVRLFLSKLKLVQPPATTHG